VAKKDGDEEAGEEELHGRGYAASVPTAQPVAGEELATAWPREAKDVFEVRKRGREGARDGGIERSARSAEEPPTSAPPAAPVATWRETIRSRP
jgi:hypothetical protein